MPLLRAKDEFYESVEGIHFLMRDPDRRKYVACLITRVALIGRGTAHEPPLGSMQVHYARQSPRRDDGAHDPPVL